MIKRKPLLTNWTMVILVFMLVAGLGLRLIQLTNPPLDFHPDRQLHSAIIARGMYFQMLPNIDPALRQVAISLWKAQTVYEPQILERIVALTYYIIGSEQLWVARIYSSIFWIIGGLAVFGLARRMTSEAGGLIALAFYLFIPFGVIASRSFQPDPFMVMWILLALYSLYRWSEGQKWKWALLTGLLAGLAALVKIFAAAILAPALVAVVLSTVGLRKIVKNWQIWLMAGISIAIPAVYYLLSIGARSSGFFDFWVLSYTNLIITPHFYFAWLSMTGIVIGIGTVFISLASLVLLSGKGRILALGVWAGYGLFGLLEPYQISTHDYYSLVIIPIVALSLSPIFALVLGKVSLQPRLGKVFFNIILVLFIAFQALLGRNILMSNNYRAEPTAWKEMGLELPRDGKIIALTHEYGMRLSYFGFIQVDLWPYAVDFSMLGMQNGEQGNGQLSSSEFDQYFLSKTSGDRYFLVDLFSELDSQPLLKAKLYNTYSVSKQGNGYILFDLAHPLPSSINQ